MSGKIDTARALQGVGIIAAASASGTIFALSHVTLPSLYIAPVPLQLRQWAIVFSRGLRTGPLLAITSTLSFGYLAYATPPVRKLYSAAAATTFLIFAYTPIFMVPINNELHRRVALVEKHGESEAVTEADGPSSTELLDQWRMYNYFRSSMPLLGAILGTWAALH